MHLVGGLNVDNCLKLPLAIHPFFSGSLRSRDIFHGGSFAFQLETMALKEEWGNLPRSETYPPNRAEVGDFFWRTQNRFTPALPVHLLE